MDGTRLQGYGNFITFPPLPPPAITRKATTTVGTVGNGFHDTVTPRGHIARKAFEALSGAGSPYLLQCWVFNPLAAVINEVSGLPCFTS
jgi:hypothetical protein